MNKVTVRAKTVEEAVQSALSQLQTSEDQVNIRVIEEPSKGFLGIGAKQAVVEVERNDFVEPEESVSAVQSGKDEEKDTVHEKQSDLENESAAQEHSSSDQENVAVEKAKQFLQNVLEKMKIQAQIEQRKEEDFWVFDVTGSKLGLLIGRRGQTLDSLQYLTNLVANRHSDQYVRIVIDAENYRERRKETLEQLADRVAKKVIRTRSKVALEPMNAAERKIIHTHLANYAGVQTKSDGEGPHRHIVIYPK